MKFEIFKDDNGQFRFRLKSANGKIICQSEAYTRKHNAYKGIKAVCGANAKTKIVEV